MARLGPPDTSFAVGQERALVRVEFHGRFVETALFDGDEVPFGRGPFGDDTSIRIAHSPPDRAVPREAGHLLVAGGRVFVDSGVVAADVDRPPRPMVITGHGGADFLLPVGAAYSPRSSRFEIRVQASHGVVRLAVAVRLRRRGNTPGGDSSRRQAIELDQEELDVYRAFRAPIERGEVETATTAEVAARLGLHRNTVSNRVYGVYDRLWSLEVPMYNSSDKVTAVVHTLMAHGIDTDPS